MRLRSLAVIAIVAGTFAGLVSPATPALAADPVCTSATHDNIGWPWMRSDNDIEGIRAPIDLRSSGLICQPGNGFPAGNTSAWIAIQQQPGTGTGIVQIGFFHLWDSSTQSGKWCKFWEVVPAPPQSYDCRDSNNDTFTYFDIVLQGSPLSQTYSIYDCGTAGGYDLPNCSLKSSIQSPYGSPEGAVASEAHGACVVEMMGTATDQEKYGNASFPFEGKTSSGWAKRTFGSMVTPACSTQYGWRK